MRYQSQELMKLESHNETFQRRVQDANKHWKLFYLNYQYGKKITYARLQKS